MRVLLWLSVLAVVVGVLVAVMPRVAASGGICAFVPCDPATPLLGWSRGPDGALVLELGPRSGAQTTRIELFGSHDLEADEPVLWSVARAAEAPWDGALRLGAAPPGFTTDVELSGATPAVAQVRVDNGCYFSWIDVPAAAPAAGKVTIQDDVDLTSAEFASQDTGYTGCPPAQLPSVNRWGFAVVAAGVVALVLRRLSIRARPDA